jgi:hypothetical protein
MNYEEAIARIYEHLENDHVEKAVMGCLRVARAAKIISTRLFSCGNCIPIKRRLFAPYTTIRPTSTETLKSFCTKPLLIVGWSFMSSI